MMANAFHAQHGIEAPFRTLRLVDDENGLNIVVQSSGGTSKAHELRFDGPYGYRNFDEGDVHKYLRRHGIIAAGCYELPASELFNWAAEENLHEELPEGVKHFAIVSSDDVIEVLAFDPPEVREISTDD